MTTRTTDKGDPRGVTFLPLQEIKPDPRNPKAHDAESIDSSIGRFGMVDGIVRDDRTGFIVSGHGRRKALQAMKDRGETPPEGVKVNSDGDWLIPVLTGWASRTDSEAAAALIAMNRTTELGGWVDESLLEMLEELSLVEGGLVGVGYDETALDNLRTWMDHVDARTADSDPGRDLDELEDEFGSMTEDDRRVPVVLKLPPSLAGKFSALLESSGSVDQLVEGWIAEAEKEGVLDGLDGSE